MALKLGSLHVGKPTIGLVLGSGGSKGWAHLGVLKALDEAGIGIDLITGTSAGAVVGAYYAGGALEEITDFALNYTSRRQTLSYLDMTLNAGGLIDGNRFIQQIGKLLPVRSFEDLNIPLGLVSTDLTNMQEVHITSGALLPAIKASGAIPGFIVPEVHNGMTLVDGGVLNPVPVSLARKMGADVVIAVDLNQYHSKPELGKLRDIAGRTVDTMLNRIRLANREANPSDVLITPPLSEFKLLDFHRAEEVIELGYQETLINLPKIKETLAEVITIKEDRVILNSPRLSAGIKRLSFKS